MTALSNGTYVVSTPDWTNPSTGAADAGAVTFVKAITTHFAGLQEGDTVPAGGQTLKISYLNDEVTLTVSSSSGAAVNDESSATVDVATVA